MGKTLKQIQLDSDDLVLKEKSDTPDQVARRRGVAYAFADMMELAVHERYIPQLFQHLCKDPPQGYRNTSIQQLLRADRAVWTKIVETLLWQSDVTWQDFDHWTRLFPRLCAVPRSFSIWSRCQSQLNPKVSGKRSNGTNSGAKMTNGRASSGTSGSRMTQRKEKAKAKVSDPTWCPKSSSTRAASVWIIMADVFALGTI